jgi:hypothetical protein
LIKESDAALALLALRNVIRAAEWFARDLQSSSNDNPTAWIAEFRDMVPDLVNARDALEHFDDYAAGRGRLQRNSPEIFSFSLSFAGSSSNPVVNVGRLSINLLNSREACRWLVIKLLAAHERAQPLDDERLDKAESLLDQVIGEQAD